MVLEDVDSRFKSKDLERDSSLNTFSFLSKMRARELVFEAVEESRVLPENTNAGCGELVESRTVKE
jgi:hypothetical protein